MKQFLRTYLPKSLYHVAQRLFWRVRAALPQNRLGAVQYKNLDALKCEVAYNRYGAYCVPLSSMRRPVAQITRLGDVHERHTLKFIRSACGDGDVVHAGAYFGDFLPALASGCAPGARVWAFEPNPENFRCAQITLLLNGLENVSLQNAGLGAIAGAGQVKTVDAKGAALGGGSYVRPGEANTAVGFHAIPIVTIDETVPASRRVSVIHLDVEGYELAALRGALQTIRRCHPILILENLPHSQLLDDAWFAEQIAGLGYKKTRTVDQNVVLRCERKKH